MKRLIVLAAILFTCNALAAEPPLIRFGRGFAAEEQVWLMSVRTASRPTLRGRSTPAPRRGSR